MNEASTWNAAVTGWPASWPSCSGTSAGSPTRWRAATTSGSTCSTRQAAKLQQVDAELAEVERMLKLDQAGAAGACGSCGALYARGSVFCWQCGKDLMAADAWARSPRREPAVRGHRMAG